MTATTPAPTRFARVLRADELRDGELVPVEIDGTPVVLVRHRGQFHALANNCTHRDFPLSAAGFDPRDGVLVCAWHNGCFDVRTGQAVVPPPTEPVETFPVRVAGGWVEIGLAGSLDPGSLGSGDPASYPSGESGSRGERGEPGEPGSRGEPRERGERRAP